MNENKSTYSIEQAVEHYENIDKEYDVREDPIYKKADVWWQAKTGPEQVDIIQKHFKHAYGKHAARHILVLYLRDLSTITRPTIKLSQIESGVSKEENTQDIKFHVKIKHKSSGNTWGDIITLDELLNRNGRLYSSSIQEIVFKRRFTGLQDKNSKDRFEGDIIKRSTGYIFIEEMKFFSLGNGSGAQAYGCDYHPDDEIIGNIFENPELITK